MSKKLSIKRAALEEQASEKILRQMNDAFLRCDSPLSVIIAIKKAALILDAAAKEVLADANKEYEMLADANGKLQIFGASLSKYTKPAQYTYSQALIAEEIQLKAKKETERTLGTAKKVEEPFNPAVNSRFMVKLNPDSE